MQQSPVPSTSSAIPPDLPVLPSTSCGGAAGSGLRRAAPAKQERSLLRTVMLRLQDNRLEGTDYEEQQTTARKRNRAEDDSSYSLLKTILNAVFVTTGLALLISVIIVVIYTSVVKDDHRTTDSPHLGTPGQMDSSVGAAGVDKTVVNRLPDAGDSRPDGDQPRYHVFDETSSRPHSPPKQLPVTDDVSGEESRKRKASTADNGGGVGGGGGGGKRSTTTRCRVVPLVVAGEPPRLAQLCFESTLGAANDVTVT